MNKKTLNIALMILLGLVFSACNTQTMNAPAVEASTSEVAGTVTNVPPTATPQPTETPLPTATATTAPTETQIPLVSVDGGMSAELVLSNTSDRNIAIYWLNLNGEEEFAKRLTPGQSYTQETFVEHAWRVRDEASGEIIKDIVVKSRETNLPIIVPVSIASLSTLEPTPTVIPVLVENGDGCEITDPRHSYFGKECMIDGIRIFASDAVQDQALKQAWYIVSNMLASRPDVREQLSNRGLEVMIFPAGKDASDLPVAIDTDEAFANADDDADPRFITGENNLMCVGGGQEYQGYSVTAHEFAHSIHMVGLNSVEPGFDNRLAAIYSAAISAGKWEGHYAATDKYEYWAEGVVMYFDASPTNYENHPVNTKAELQEYDSDLYSLVEEIFRGLEWTPICP